MSGDAAQSLGIVLAAIVAASLALSQAVGPLLVYLTEAVKATGKVKDGYAGMVTLVLGMVIGGALGGLSDAIADESYGFGVMVALGVFAGALMAAGAVSSYKAMGDVNTSAGSASDAATIDAAASAIVTSDIDQSVMSDHDLSVMQSALDDHDTSAGNVTPAPPLVTTAPVVTPAR
jgi:hypothetical protein